MIPFISIKSTAETKLSDILGENPYLLLLLEHFEIEVPVREQTIAEVCAKNNINTSLFLTFVDLYNGQKRISEFPFSVNDALTMVNYLKNSHKYYSEEVYPGILATIKRMHQINNSKEMNLVESFFIDYFSEVTEHLKYEDEVVFPYILNLYNRIKKLDLPEISTKYTVKQYKDHHDDIEEKLNDLKNLLIKYLPSQNDREVRRELLFSLFKLEYDINIHSQIEDYILIPLVAEMENIIKKDK